MANSTIGSTGFGYSFIDGRHQLIPHNGGVILEDGVEIGANTCVDRAKFGNTIIGAGTKIDNLVQIAHNVVIGKACLLAGQVGHCRQYAIGNGVIMAWPVGNVGQYDRRRRRHCRRQCDVFEDIAPGQKVWGTPASDMQDQMKSISRFSKIAGTGKRIKRTFQESGTT